jgi:hypothetical protein
MEAQGPAVARVLRSKEKSPQWWLCSHLVELEFEDERFPPRLANLEEIEAAGAALAVESPYPVGTKLALKAGTFAIPAEVVFRLPRETDFLLGIRFATGRRWNPDTWKPDHLYLPPAREKKLRRTAKHGG